MRYRIKTVSTSDGATKHYPQYKRFGLFWCNFYRKNPFDIMELVVYRKLQAARDYIQLHTTAQYYTAQKIVVTSTKYTDFR